MGFGIEYTDDFLNEIINDYKSYISDEDESRAISLASLPYADDEVINTAKVLNGEAIINESVTPSVVLEKLSKYKIAHFSAHALNNSEDYLNSFLVLNKDENDEFRLRFKDIINLKLNNDLVVLSACQTGIGENIYGEGAMSLSRAFLQSGVQSSMGSYWNAPDKSTKELMKHFLSVSRSRHDKI